MRTRASRESTASQPARWSPAAASTPHALGNQEIQRARRGTPVDARVRERVARVTGATLDDVVVHTGPGAEAMAADMAARAVTVGREIHFGRGQYRPGTLDGDRLIAHELAHAGQQARGGDVAQAQLEVGFSDQPAEREADRIADATMEPGTPRRVPVTAARTSIARAPLATESPQSELQAELKSELTLFGNAQQIIDWLRPREPGPRLKSTDPVFTREMPDYMDPRTPRVLGPFPGAQPFTFTIADVMTDAALVKKLKPPAVATVAPTLQLLTDKGVITPGAFAGVFIVPVDPDSGHMLTRRLDSDRSSITDFSRKFDARIAADQPVVETGLMDRSMSSDKKQMALEAEVQARVDALQGKPSSPTVDAQLRAAEAELFIRQNYRRFSLEVLAWLKRLRARNVNWNAGTYPAHQWREFSVDVFPSKWDEASLLQLFDDINAACDDTTSDSFGPFAWFGIFNHASIRNKVNAKFGARFVGEAPGHEDHIHLNLKPLQLQKDNVTGYKIIGGRVVLN